MWKLRLYLALLFSTMIANWGMAGSFVYVNNAATNSISVIDTNLNRVGSTISLGSPPTGIALTPDGKRAYVSTSSSIAVIRLGDNSLLTTIAMPLGANLKHVAASMDSQRVYATDAGRNLVVVIDTSNNTIVANIAGLVGPTAIAVNPRPQDPSVPYAYTLHPTLNTMSVINLATNLVANSVLLGNQPAGIAITPDGTKAYVANFGSNNVSVINLATNAVTATIATGTAPKGIAITPDGRFAYVANSGSNNVSVINLATNAVTSTLSVGSSPSGVTMAAGGNLVYVSNSGSGTVSAVNPRATPTPQVATTVTVSGTPQALVGGSFDWFTYGNSLQRWNFNGNETAITKGKVQTLGLTLKWSMQVNGDVKNSPIVAGSYPFDPNCNGVTKTTDGIFIGDDGGTIWALDANNNGALLWQTTKSDGVDGTLFFDRANDYVYANGLFILHALKASNPNCACTNGCNWDVQMTDPSRDEEVAVALNSEITVNKTLTPSWIYAGVSEHNTNQRQGKVVAVEIGDQTLPRSCWSTPKQNCKVTYMWDILAYPNCYGSGIWGYGGPSLHTDVNRLTQDLNYIYVGTGNHGSANDPNCQVPNEAFNNGDTIVALRGTNSTTGVPMGLRQAWFNNTLVGFPNNDMGSTPTLFTPSGCTTPLAAVFQKKGNIYIFNQDSIPEPNGDPKQTIMYATGFQNGVAAFNPVTNALFVRHWTGGGGQHCIKRLDPTGCTYAQTKEFCYANPSNDQTQVVSPTLVSTPDNTSHLLFVGLSGGPGDTKLFAFDISNPGQLDPIWDSGTTIQGALFGAAPIVYNGRVYITTRSPGAPIQGKIYAFGLP